MDSLLELTPLPYFVVVDWSLSCFVMQVPILMIIKNLCFSSWCMYWPPGPEVIKLFSCSTHLRMKFILPIKIKYQQFKLFSCTTELSMKLFLLIKIVGILIFISRKNFMLSWVEYEKKLYYIGARPALQQTWPTKSMFHSVPVLHLKSAFIIPSANKIWGRGVYRNHPVHPSVCPSVHYIW